MDDEDYFVAELELFPQGKKKTALFGVGVTIRAGIGELVRVAHPDHVACDEAAQATTHGHHIPPAVGRGGVAVSEDDRSTFADVTIAMRCHVISMNCN